MSLPVGTLHPLVLAIDVGGTKTHIAYKHEGSMRTVLNTGTPQSPERWVDMVVDAVEGSSLAIDGVGVGCPGPLDQNTGSVLSPPALPLWDNFSLTDQLSAKLGVPVALENDGNAGALGEAAYGSGRGFRRVFYMAIGTGIGTGIVIDERIYSGSHGLAGEIWAFDPGSFRGEETHIINDVASGLGLAKQNTNAGHAPREAVAILDAAASGEPDAMALVEQAHATLAAALCFVVYLLDPDLIVLGGGMCTHPERIVDPVTKRVRGRLAIERLRDVPIRRATLWDEAVLYGATALMEQHLKSNTR